MDPHPTDEVSPFKAEYEKEKNKILTSGTAAQTVDKLIRKLRETFVMIEKTRMDEAENSICTAATEKAKKVAHEKNVCFPVMEHPNC